MKLTVHTDGGARGNPGPAAIGVVIDGDSVRVAEFGKRIGETTNNVAEYTAVVEALRHIADAGLSEASHEPRAERVQFVLDSMLVVNQLMGLFKVKDAKLRELLFEVRALEQQIGIPVTYTAVPREQNRRADYLVNAALDHLI